MYQFFLNSTDDMVGGYLRYFTFLSHPEIESLDAETAERPERRAAQRALARAVTAMVHGDGEVARCEEASAALFGEEIASLSEEMLLAVTEDALTRTHLAKSKGEARRTIEQGGAYVNNARQSDVARVLGTGDLLHDRYIVLRRGPRDIHVLRAA
jgi:tyrosyl-tRNA synthetase